MPTALPSRTSTMRPAGAIGEPEQLTQLSILVDERGLRGRHGDQGVQLGL
jgi:hypothetical protein